MNVLLLLFFLSLTSHAGLLGRMAGHALSGAAMGAGMSLMGGMGMYGGGMMNPMMMGGMGGMMNPMMMGGMNPMMMGGMNPMMMGGMGGMMGQVY